MQTVLKALAFIVLLLGGGFYFINHHQAVPFLKIKKEENLFQNIAPHKAVYKIKLTHAKSASQIVNITGEMTFEIFPTCGGWITNYTFDSKYDYADSPSVISISDFSTFESLDGKTLNFASQRGHNGNIVEEIRGVADKEINEATYFMPEGLTFELPDDTLFPTIHTAEILKRAHKGDLFYNAVIFDGSDEEGPVQVNTYISEKKTSLDEEVSNNDKINSVVLTPAPYKVRMSFFPLASREATPDYEVELRLHDNGIVSDIMIDYDDFSLHQSLISLEKLENRCNNPDNSANITS